jgi:hypothetical protein
LVIWTGIALVVGHIMLTFGLAGFFRVTRDGMIAEERYYYDRLEFIQPTQPGLLALIPARPSVSLSIGLQ